MGSLIYYKFKSAKDYDVYRFEGAGVPVWELKAEIVSAKKLPKSSDYDLIVSNAQSQQDFTDDNQLVPRNASVVVRRVPATGKHRPRPPAEYKPPPSFASAAGTAAASKPATGEDAKIKAMLSESTAHWAMNQEMPSQYAPPSSSIACRAQYSMKRKRPQRMYGVPEGYICFRCGDKGHHINNCPTVEDPTFDRPRIKRTTGIPKTFLKPVSASERTTAEGLMVTSEGGMVVAVPNEDEWRKISSKAKADNIPDDLRCGICDQLLTEPVSAACCRASYCEECVRELAECPSCHKRPLRFSLDEAIRRRCQAFVAGPEDKRAPDAPPKSPDTSTGRPQKHARHS